MYAKIIALFALIAVAFAAPKPEPSPQAVIYPGAAAVEYVSPYSAYGAYAPYVSPYAAPAVVPYSAYPYFVKK